MPSQKPNSTSSTPAEPTTRKTEPPFMRSPYNYDLKAASDENATINNEPSLTIQSMSEDADINVMMERMGVTGRMPDVLPQLPTYADYDEVFDFRTALERVTAAKDAFMAYPARLRAEFDNDPGKFLDFVGNEANKPRLKELGLLKPETAPPALSKDTQAIIEAVKTAQTATGAGSKPPASSGTT